MKTLPCSRDAQTGQAMVEYAIAGAILVGALFVAEYGGKTGAQYLTEMIKLFFANLSMLISIP